MSWSVVALTWPVPVVILSGSEVNLSRDSKSFPTGVSTSSRSILLMCSAWCLPISSFKTCRTSPNPSSLSERNMLTSDRSKVCAMVFGFAATCRNSGLLVSGSVPFSAIPPPFVKSARPVRILQPLRSHGFFGSIENALNSWFNCDHTLRP